MADSVYRVTEVVGVSTDSWEQATKSAVESDPLRTPAASRASVRYMYVGLRPKGRETRWTRVS